MKTGGEEHADPSLPLGLYALYGMSMVAKHTFAFSAAHCIPNHSASTLYVSNAFVAALAWLYVVSGGFHATGILDGVYEIQSAMLREGRLTIEPGPLSVFYHDALMYWGQYYFYWGLLPSILFAVLETMVGRIAAHYLIVFLFLFSLVYFFQRLIGELVDAASSDDSSPSSVVILSAIMLTWVLLFVVPYPLEHGWFFGRFAVYEQQVLFGLALGFPGLYFLIRGLRKRRLFWVAMGTLFFCLAACTRVTWFPWAIIALACTALLRRSWGRDGEPGSMKRSWLMPWGVGFLLILGLVCLNEFRFGSLTDFGVRYQNPGHYLYFRNLKMFFSPLTRLWNCAFNLMSYYAPPTMVENLGLEARSFAFCEGFPPSFFSFNPHFLLLVVLAPLGLYRMIKKQRALILPFATVMASAAYLHLIVGFFGTFVILRYFVEFYYVTALCFLAIVLMLLRPPWAALALVAMLGLYIPGTVKHCASVTPELRTIDWSSGRNVPAISGGTPFLEPAGTWPIGSFSVQNARKTPQYAAMGVRRGGPSTLVGADIFAVYLVPDTNPDGSPLPTLTVRRLRSGTKGRVLFFFEDRPVGSVDLKPDQALDVSIGLAFTLPRLGPYQIMGVFLEEGTSYLPGRTSGKAVLAFEEISLHHRR